MKTKTFTLLFVHLLIAVVLQAQWAYHNQDIYTSEIWTADSLHYITANITLHAPATLTIQAGTEIRFRNGSTFTIQGSVHANGLSSLIHIKGDTGDKGRIKLVDAGDSWFKYVNFHYGGSLVIDNSDEVLVENCDFFDGSNQRPAGLTIQNNAAPEINQCQFYNDSYGMEVANSSTPIISNCTFEGLGNAMIIGTGASPTVLNCIFTTNNIGIFLLSAGEPLITNCIMNENNYHGARIQGASSNPLFTNCQFNQNAQSGILVKTDGQGFFTDCQANLNGSHGLKISYNEGSVTLNNFAANQNGGDGVYARQGNLVVTSLEVNDNMGFGLNFDDDNDFVDHDLYIDDIVAYGNDTTAIRVSAQAAGALLHTNVNLDFQNNHPDGIEIFDGDIRENTIWPEPPFNIDLYLGGLYIADGASLEIIHHNILTAIYCRAEAEIKVIGTLKAENIEFLPAVEVAPRSNKGYWKGIYFSNSDSSELKNVTVKNAGFSNTGGRFAGIEIHSSAPPQDSAVIINDCYVEDCAGDGIYIYRSNPLIINSFIAGCDSAGIYLDYYAKPIVDSCIIMQNGSYGIFCNHQYSGGRLNASQITNNQGPAVRLPMNMVGGLNNSIITGNQRKKKIEIAGGYLEDDAIWPGNLEYYIYKKIRADPGKLTIAPGGVLKFLPYTNLTVKSSLNAIGTSDQHIVFTSAQDDPAPGVWQGLYFHHAADTSNLSYCDIKYAGQSEWEPNIYTENSEVYISHCDISYSGSHGIINMGGGDGKYLNITDCNIHHNQLHGLSSEWFWYNYTHISHTSIYGNGEYPIVAPADVLRFFTENINIHSNGHDAIKVVGGWEPGAFDGQINQGTWRNHGVPYEISQHVAVVDGETLTIEKGNTFYMEDEVVFWVDGALSAIGNADSAITFNRMPGSEGHWQHILFKNDTATSELEHCHFSHGGFYPETKSDTAAMISLVQADVKFQNCSVDSSYSNGIYLNHQASAEFVNSRINDNAASGIYIGGDGENNLTFGSSLAGWNDIYGNGSYNISNNNPGNIDAGYIWWGTIEDDEIAAGIFENTGTVNYTPWTNAGHTQLYPAGPPTQEIALTAGWNSLSSYVMPDNPALEEVFAPIADELIIAQTMTAFYYPAENTNNIGNWPEHAAFIIKTNAACTLPLTGEMEANQQVSLDAGWSLLPVVATTAVSADDLLSPLDGLVIAKDVAGTGVLWPEYGINTLGSLNPGKAYFVKTNAPGVVNFAGAKSCEESQAVLPYPSGLQIHPNPITHTIAILPSALKNIPQANIIAAFDEDDRCYGAAVYDDETICLTIFGDDPTSMNKVGFTEGEQIFFKIYDPENGEATELIPQFSPAYPLNGDTFSENGISVITAFQNTSSVYAYKIFDEITIFPNPSSGQVTVSGIVEGSSVIITDLFGKVILSNRVADKQQIQLNLSAYPAGVYFINVQFKELSMFQKLILR